ncbi:tetratricopeptide repeat protein [Streptomyces sp. IBSNAI002]|uniref:tetratricopeptide repeat protein n=1 Tax=Streptomyces sp. IBSNAI002 TaxID=3457500 RepID=UPI003FD35F48
MDHDEVTDQPEEARPSSAYAQSLAEFFARTGAKGVELATHAGYHPSVISRYLKGVRIAPAEFLPEFRSFLAAHGQPISDEEFTGLDTLRRSAQAAGRGHSARAAYSRERIAELEKQVERITARVRERKGGAAVEPGGVAARVNDAHLHVAQSVAPSVAPSQAPPMTLPAAPRGFVGRTGVLRDIMTWLRPDPATNPCEDASSAVLAVAGMGGPGKTALALQAAHQARAGGWFSGGILFADVHGYSPGPPAEISTVVDRFLLGFGVKSSDLPDSTDQKLDAWRTLTDRLAEEGRPLLVVLDNVRTAGQVAGLLPSHPHRALVTSRQTLSALLAHRIGLGPLAPDDAVALLDKALRTGSSGDGRVTGQRPDALRLAELCGHLPLALRITAALLCDDRRRPLAHQADDLADARTRLQAMQYDDVDEQGRPLAVDASIDLSYGLLSTATARAFRLLAPAPGPDISTDSAAVLLGRSPAQTRRILAELARAHLLLPSPTEHERWAMHDLVRLFADEQGRRHAAEDQRDAAVKSLMSHYCTTAEAADTHLQGDCDLPVSDLFPGKDSAATWLEGERANLIATVIAAGEYEHPAATSLAPTLYRFLDLWSHYADMLAVNGVALGACRERGDRLGEAKALNALGIAHRVSGHPQKAIDAHAASADICRDLGERPGEAAAMNNLGSALYLAGRHEEALDARIVAIGLFRETGRRVGEGEALSNRGNTLVSMGRLEEAIDTHTAAVDVFRTIGDRHSEGQALDSLGNTLRAVGRLEEAVDAHAAATRLLKESNDHHRRSRAQRGLGIALHEAGRFEEEIHARTTAIELFQKIKNHVEAGVEFIHMGVALREVGRLEEAIDAHADAVRIFAETKTPSHEVWALNKLAGCTVEAGRYKEAVAHHTRALALAPDSLASITGRGLACFSLGQYDQALADLDRADELAPDSAPVLAVRSSVHRLLGQYERALADVDRAVELDRHAPKGSRCAVSLSASQADSRRRLPILTAPSDRLRTTAGFTTRRRWLSMPYEPRAVRCTWRARLKSSPLDPAGRDHARQMSPTSFWRTA